MKTLLAILSLAAWPAPVLTIHAAAAPAEEIGSLKNARAAVPISGSRASLTYFARSMSQADLAKEAKAAPNVHIVVGLTRRQALDRAGEADAIDAGYATPEFLARATKLVWVQVPSIGVEGYVGLAGIAKNDAVVLTNARIAFAPSVADHAMAMLLYMTRDLRDYSAQQAEHRWYRDGPRPKIVLDGRTMLVVGVGGIGTGIAERAHGFGMRVIGTRRSSAPAPAVFARVGQSKDLLSMLPEADVVVVAVPLTRETEGMFNRAAFAAMKKGSYLINIARGKVVDTAALTEALNDGTLAGAGLDVTDPEPLPSDSPLWAMPSVFITPHAAGQSHESDERESELVAENIRRFGAGEPLLNVVDKKAGY